MCTTMRILPGHGMRSRAVDDCPNRTQCNIAREIDARYRHHSDQTGRMPSVQAPSLIPLLRCQNQFVVANQRRPVNEKEAMG